MLKENNFKRMCSFYVSNIHLSTMILPYLSEKIEKGEILTTFLEKDIQKEMELLLSKTNIKESLKTTINSINWYKTNKVKYLEIENHMDKFKRNKKINILVVGTNKYIEEINKNLIKYLKKNESCTVDIIDAYEVEENKQNIDKIISNYEYMINTSGQHLVKEVFKSNNNSDTKKIG